MIEAMKQALEALEDPLSPTKRVNAITALRQAITEAEKQDTRSAAYWDWAGWKSSQSKSEKQEPVDGVVLREGFPTLLRKSDIKPTDQRLYTHPPKRKPLTDEQIDSILIGLMRQNKSGAVTIARAIEVAHGIKGEA